PPNNGGLYIDPSGTVHTHGGHPIARARVVLLRAARRHARLRPVRRGSAIMSPANRRNPDHSDEFGLFGWDVQPGYYQVRASHRGCAKGATGVLHVPPPALGLSIALSCPRLHYARSTVSLRIARERSVRRTHTLLLTVRVRGRRGHGRPAGVVTLRAGRRSLGQVALDARSGTATLVAVVAGRPRLRASYSGDGGYAASHSRTITPRR
ncbi:MAG: Ig-like domain-containing protein, partial [Solirubrobacteraceae bacterium]